MPPTTETYDVGVVGAGTIASSTHLPVLANADRASLRFVADVDRGQVKPLARSYGIEGVTTDDPADLPSCDVAVLATPVGVREPYVEEFGRRGTPVFAEKPFAPDLETHDAFVDAVETVSCNYLRLTFGATRTLRRIVQSGVFGDVERVELSEGGIVGATGRGQGDYQTDADLGRGGILMERGSHVFSQLVSVLDASTVDVVSSTITVDEGYDVDVTAEFEATVDDRSVPVTFDLTRIRPVAHEFRVVFENATAAVDIDSPDAEVIVSRDGTEVGRISPDDRWASTFAQSASLRWRQFCSKLGPDDEYPEDVATGRDVTRLIETIYDEAEVTEL